MAIIPLHDGSSISIRLDGWTRSKFDSRDAAFSLKMHPLAVSAPTEVDLRPYCSPIQDQGELGSCTAHAVGAAMEFNENKRSAGLPASASAAMMLGRALALLVFIHVSRLLNYFNTRKLEGTIHQDAGGSIRDAVKAPAKFGTCDERLYPYVIANFAKTPPKSVLAAASLHKITSYHAIADGDLGSIKAALAMGKLVVLGFQVYSAMMTQEMAHAAFLNVPGPNETLEGGHAIALVGYSDTKRAFLVRNSWGTSWGIAGYFWMSYDYVARTDLAGDIWVIESSPF